MRTRRTAVISTSLLILYALTWFFGPASYLAAIRAKATKKYQNAVEGEKSKREFAAANGIEPPESILLQNGPNVGVRWSVPILPFVLLVNSYEVIGPLWAHGGPRIVIWYGFSTVYLNTPFGWVS